MQSGINRKAVPVRGKTFSLFGAAETSAGYYRDVAALADACLVLEPDIGSLTAEVRRLGKRPRLARSLAATTASSAGCFIVRSARTLLAPYTTAVKEHLAGLSLIKRFDGVLSFTEEQYHLAMLEIELMNRMHAAAFRRAGRKLAFLPHCLRDLEANCRAAPQDIDYACMGCSARCTVNAVSELLRENGIEPYIWMRAGLRKLLRDMQDAEGGLGVMGIACVPELVRGMRMCVKLDIPVVGIPLNANRCARWTGKFHPTSVDLASVRRLLGGGP